jgi:Protein of unknown function (DUF3105)
MANRREEKERLRRERLAAERREASEARRRLLLGYVVAGVLGAIVVVGIVVAIVSGGGGGEEAEVNEAAGVDPNTGFVVPADITPDEREGTPPPPVGQADLERAAEAAGCELELGLPDEGNTHLRPNDDPPDYKTEPPSSGDHSVENLADGAYLDYPDPVNFVHSLEHGRIEIQYDPGLPEDEQLALKGLFDEDPEGMLMFPNPEMRHEVAAVTWTNMMTCDSYSPEVIDAIRAFRDTYRGQGPESVPF